MSGLKFVSRYHRNGRLEDGFLLRGLWQIAQRDVIFFAHVSFRRSPTANGLNIFHEPSRNISDCGGSSYAPRYIQYISLKSLSTVEGTMQYGAQNKLTRKINVRSWFVSSLFHVGEVAPVSLILYHRLVSMIFSHLTLWISDIERGRNRDWRGKGASPVFNPDETCSDANVCEMQPIKFDYANWDRSFG